MSATENPFNALITACNNDAHEVSRGYSQHRKNRNDQQRAKLLSPNFTGMSLDPILMKLVDPTLSPGFVDLRHCLVFWARPPARIRDLVHSIQLELVRAAPNLWLMPQDCLHMTVLEVTHSLTEQKLAPIIDKIAPHVKSIADYTYSHRVGLYKPLLSYDSQGIALTFLPKPSSLPSTSIGNEMDQFTYHHLRRDIYRLASEAGADMNCRYIAPSSHITVGRFINQSDFVTGDQADPEKVKRWIEVVEKINGRLERDPEMGEWTVGEERGLDHRKGALWYGGGESIYVGKGFVDQRFDESQEFSLFGNWK